MDYYLVLVFFSHTEVQPILQTCIVLHTEDCWADCTNMEKICCCI